MKNFFKLMGVIAMVAVIGFSMAACGGDEDGGGGGSSDFTLKVVNNNSETITGIRVFEYDGSNGITVLEKSDLSIANGQSQSFSFSSANFGKVVELGVSLKIPDGGNYHFNYFIFTRGKTSTVTLKADGTVSKE
jgi:hypothetical protein